MAQSNSPLALHVTPHLSTLTSAALNIPPARYIYNNRSIADTESALIVQCTRVRRVHQPPSFRIYMTAMEVSPPIAAERTLFSIPIIHTLADMGEFGDSLKRMKLSTIGREKVNRGAHLVDKVWDEIERTIETIPIAFGKFRIYQDGLPVCGIEDRIVSDLAAAGSRNHKLLLELRTKGALLMGTESPELLIEEYNRAAGELNRGKMAGRVRRTDASDDSLLARRDLYIASRINQTLSPGETAILFLGMLHQAERYLNPDIRVIHPISLS